MDNHVIAIDAMGGDNAPVEIIKGAVESLSACPVKILLIGKEDILHQELGKYTYDKSRIEVVNATEVIETSETPTIAIKQKKDSSMVVGFALLKEDRAKAFISAGNTGALLTGATLKVGRIRGIARAALATLLPTKKGFSLLIDCGANVDCKPEYLAQFAMMGSVYMENVRGIKSPKVAIANIGVEEEKGNALVKEAHALLKTQDNINFVGNMEVRDIMSGEVDVIVCDGFVGNIILKSSEGVAKHVLNTIKSEVTSTIIRRIGAKLAKLKNIKKKFDHSEVGGVPFLGLKSLVVKAHGSAQAKDIVGAVNQAYQFIENDLIQKIEAKV